MYAERGCYTKKHKHYIKIPFSLYKKYTAGGGGRPIECTYFMDGRNSLHQSTLHNEHKVISH